MPSRTEEIHVRAHNYMCILTYCSKLLIIFLCVLIAYLLFIVFDVVYFLKSMFFYILKESNLTVMLHCVHT